MLLTKEKEIQGMNVKVTQFGGIEAMQLKVALAKLMAPALAGLAGVNPNANILEQEVKPELLTKVFNSLFATMTENDFIALIKRILRNTMIQIENESGDKIWVQMDSDFNNKFDLVFSGKVFSVYPVLWFVLEVNYPDFFGIISGIGNRLKTTIGAEVKQAGKS